MVGESLVPNSKFMLYNKSYVGQSYDVQQEGHFSWVRAEMRQNQGSHSVLKASFPYRNDHQTHQHFQHVSTPSEVVPSKKRNSYIYSASYMWV